MDAILNIFIYELAKGITNESYEIVETKQVKTEQTLVETTESNQQESAASTSVVSFGEIFGNTGG